MNNDLFYQTPPFYGSLSRRYRQSVPSHEGTPGACIFFLLFALLLFAGFSCRLFAGCGKGSGALSVIFPFIYYSYEHQPWDSLSWAAANTSTDSRPRISRPKGGLFAVGTAS